MNSRPTKLKALFLLVSFSLNTVAGFACSLGIDMGYNTRSHHHHHEECEDNHSSEHKEDAVCDNDHDRNLKDEHSDESQQDHSVSYKAAEDDNCCSGFVAGFQSTDKEVVEKFSPSYSHGDYTFFEVTDSVLLEPREFHNESVRIPPKIADHSPPDIRVFIQSFQI